MIHDTMLQHHTLFCEKGVPHGLYFIGSTHADVPFYKDDIKGADNFALLPDDVLRTYNCRDVMVTDQADTGLQAEIDEALLRKVYGFDMRLLPALVRLQRSGVLIDQGRLREFRGELDLEIGECESVIKRILGDKFNPRSNQQIAQFFFEELKLKPVGLTSTRAPKVDLDAILALSEQAPPEFLPLFQVFIQHRKLYKLRKNYAKEFIVDSEGRVHTEYTLHVTPTGRLSSTDPNLQNVPDGKAKGVFVARPGYSFLSRDTDQIEIRILALIAHDDILLSIFRDGGDVHTSNACDLFSTRDLILPPGLVSKDQRDFAKTFIYGGIIYGGGAGTIRAQALHKLTRRRKPNEPLPFIPSIAEIAQSQRNYLDKHPAITKYQKEVEDEVRRNRRLVIPLGGRVRIFLGQIEFAIRAAWNTPIQGSAAHHINQCLIDLNEVVEEPNSIVLQVHDELVLEVRDDELGKYQEITKRVMEKPIDFIGQQVVFPTSLKVGKSWNEMEKIKE